MPRTVMTSCAHRTEVRAVTLEGLHAAGIRVDHTLLDPCTNPRPANVLANAHNLCSKYRSASVLFLEDDIDVKASFRRWIALAIQKDLITAFCVLRHTLLPEGTPRVPPGNPEGVTIRARLEMMPLEQLERRRGFHGTMAVYLPARVTEAITMRESEFVQPNGEPLEGDEVHGFDFWLKLNAREFGGMLAAIPNPVNHRPGVSTWGTGETIQDFQSTTFHAEEVWD